MTRTTTAEDAQAIAQVNVRIGTSLAEPLHNTTEEDVSASKFLKRAYRQGTKPAAGEACYELGCLHEHRAEAAALRVLEWDKYESTAPELEWAEAMRSADARFRDALWQGVPGAAARICQLHQIEPGQRRPIYPGDKVRIHGLVSNLGRRLNQREGVAISQEESSGRFGVAIDRFGMKHIRSANLTFLDPYGDCAGLAVRGGCSCDGCFAQLGAR